MAPRDQKPKKRNKGAHQANDRLILIGGTVLFFLAISALLLKRPGSDAAGSTGASVPAQANRTSPWTGPAQSALQLVRRFKGDPDAPVTILEFSDFQ